MARFIEGQDRNQVTWLPECLDDFIAEESTVRVVDAFINELDLAGLGFEGATPAATGRPSYHPAVMLKLYLYGYLNRIQSSRRRKWTGKPMESWAYAATLIPVLAFLPSALTTKTNRPRCSLAKSVVKNSWPDNRGSYTFGRSPSR